jgi:PAS domain S-box-containing protein
MAQAPGSDWETLFWTLFAQSDNAMAIVDADRVVVAANPALGQQLGEGDTDLTGRRLEELLQSDDSEALQRCWEAMLARGESHGMQAVPSPHGEPTPLNYATYVAHVAGKLVVLVVLMGEGAGEDDDADTPTPPGALTPREAEIVVRLALGATSRDIADDLHVTPETVRTHVRNAMAKTGTRTRAHLVAAAICRGLLPAISST